MKTRKPPQPSSVCRGRKQARKRKMTTTPPPVCAALVLRMLEGAAPFLPAFHYAYCGAFLLSVSLFAAGGGVGWGGALP